jgi:bd-type cytochrome oxidase subunit II
VRATPTARRLEADGRSEGIAVSLTTLWFVVVAYLWVGYFLLEGFDFGVGALLRPIGRSEKGRRVLINTIGPVWDGNEVWVITAAGATFAAFPHPPHPRQPPPTTTSGRHR